MLFNSFEFALFLPLVFLLYWFVFNRSVRLRNIFIVLVSYLFYGWWDWRFLFLIAFTSLCSFLSGLLIGRIRTVTPPSRKILIISRLVAASSVILNLVILCVFKYFNFFSENLAHLFQVFGYTLDWVTLDILLPVGISFYTFQALSYTIDVYKGTIEPTKDVVSFFAFVSFFPQLVAGPIERATNLLPQFYTLKSFDYAKSVDGLRQILWGLFKKIVVADNCAVAVNLIFNNYNDYSGSTLLLGALLFTFQIYGDFAGYSDIAIGTARLFGFNLMRNFNYPYFSRDIAEFWRRWHISLTTWFRDYIYIPLGGSRGTKWMSFRNTLIIFLVSGFWHGANWTFVVWGMYHAFLFLPLLLVGKNRKYKDSVVAESRTWRTLRESAQMLSTFVLVMLGWVIFRAEDLSHAYNYFSTMLGSSLFTLPVFLGKKALFFALILLGVEWIGRRNRHSLEKMPERTWMRYAIYLILTGVIVTGGNFGDNQFIYFQF